MCTFKGGLSTVRTSTACRAVGDVLCVSTQEYDSRAVLSTASHEVGKVLFMGKNTAVRWAKYCYKQNTAF